MTFLSSRDIGRGAAALPVDALITDAFLSSFVFGFQHPHFGTWKARTLIPAERADMARKRHAQPLRLDGCTIDAGEFGVMQQKFKQKTIMTGKFPENYIKFI